LKKTPLLPDAPSPLLHEAPNALTLFSPSSEAVATHLGRHLLAEFYDCNPNILNNTALIEQEMAAAAVACGATIVQQAFHHFSPYGVSGVVIIAESHLAIHTWPEYGYAAVDLFTCGDSCDPNVAYNTLRQALHAGEATCTELRRGFFDEATQQMKKLPFHVLSSRSDLASASVMGE
jgi:S-adenosylmethionine decarboxylase proenzyme